MGEMKNSLRRTVPLLYTAGCICMSCTYKGGENIQVVKKYKKIVKNSTWDENPEQKNKIT